MGYIVCEKCWGYYQLKIGESFNDFEDCQCGGKLIFTESLDMFQDEDEEGFDIPSPKIKTCPSCGSKLSEHTVVCMICFTKISPTDADDYQIIKTIPTIEVNICENCGKENAANFQFCTFCYKKLKKEDYNEKDAVNTDLENKGEEDNVCPKCNSILLEDSIICRYCAERLSSK
jgi:hypothetical protein